MYECWRSRSYGSASAVAEVGVWKVPIDLGVIQSRANPAEPLFKLQVAFPRIPTTVVSERWRPTPESRVVQATVCSNNPPPITLESTFCSLIAIA